MQRFFTRRLLAMIPTLFGVSIVVFVVIHLIPGDTISAMIGTTYKLTEAQAEALRAYFGLDKPLYQQYLHWIWAALHGDFGYSVRSGEPVMSEILHRFPVTFELTILSLLIAVLIGIPVGILSATKQDSAIDIFGRLFALIGLSLPNFWLGTLIILGLSLYFGFTEYIPLWLQCELALLIYKEVRRLKAIHTDKLCGGELENVDNN